MVKNVVTGFSTRVMLSRGQPYPYLHLGITDDILTVEVKKEGRIETDINATLINRTHESHALTKKNLYYTNNIRQSMTALDVVPNYDPHHDYINYYLDQIP